MVKKTVVKSDKKKRKLSSDKKKIQQKKKYLAEWDEMFERMKLFKQDYSKSTVPKDFPDQSLYRWYRIQKKIYNHSNQKMPKEHLDKLNSIGFYFGDGHKEREEKTANTWIRLLKEAMDSGEKIQTNHRYRYKGKGLGTYLVGVKKANKLGKKLEVRDKILALGFKLNDKDRDQISTSLRFLREIETRKDLEKVDFQNRFNHQILGRDMEIPKNIQDKINIAWKKRFGDERTWHKIKRFKSPEDSITDFVQDLLKEENPNYVMFMARFKHAIIPRKKSFNAELKQQLVQVWKAVYSETLDWDMKIKRFDVESIAADFASDLEDKEYPYGRNRIWTRFVRSIYPKRDTMSPKAVKRINKAWKNRYNENLNWKVKSSKPNPKKVALKFIDDLLIDSNPEKSTYKTRIPKLSVVRKHLSRELIQKVETMWRLRFDERFDWYPQERIIAEDDKIKLWKKFRYNKKVNPDEKWVTGPKTMGKLYGWVNRIKKNKYALAPLLFNFTEAEIKEMKRQGFRVDMNLARKAKELNI